MGLLLNTTGIESVLLVALSVIGVALVLVILWALIIKEHAKYVTWRYRRKKVELYASGNELCRTMLDNAGLGDVKVERVSFWSYWFRANTYSASSKTIFLSKRIFEKNRVLSVGTVATLVGLAKLDHENDKYAKRVGQVSIFKVIMSLLLPIIGVVVAIDFQAMSNPGIISLITTGVAAIIFGVIFVISLISIKSLKKAAIIADEMLVELNILTEDELKSVRKVLKMTYKTYIATLILSILLMFRLILVMLWNVIKLTAKNKR